MKIKDVIRERGPANVIIEALVASVEERRARNDNTFYLVTLQDATGRLTCLVFEQSLHDMLPSSLGKPVECLCEVGEYKGSLSVKIKEMTYIAVNMNEFVTMPEIAKDLDKVKAFFADVRTRFQHDDLIRLFDHFTTDEWIERYANAAAAKEIHHAYRGGFLEHIYTLMQIYLGIHDGGMYPELNSDVIFLGLLLHDIGKLEELEEISPGVYDYTVKGLAHGHLVMSYRLCSEEAIKMGLGESLLVEQVLHVILAHHGTREFGSPVLPASSEALMVHFLDNMDSKLHIVRHGTHLERQPFMGNVRLLKYDEVE